MKKLIVLLLMLTSCGTLPSVDKQNLQKQYKTVYDIRNWQYICIDSTGAVYDVRVEQDGTVYAKIKIN
jgi:starvation-inducible outer membrane lipoprotein